MRAHLGLFQAAVGLRAQRDALRVGGVGLCEVALRLEHRRPRLPKEGVRRADAAAVQVCEDGLGVAHEIGVGDPDAQVARVTGVASVVAKGVRAPLEHG